MPEAPRAFAIADTSNSSSAQPATQLSQPVPVQVATIAAAVFLVTVALGVAYVSGDKTLLSTVVSAVVAAAMILFNFQYGSSAGSQRKDDVIASKTGASPR